MNELNQSQINQYIQNALVKTIQKQEETLLNLQEELKHERELNTSTNKKVLEDRLVATVGLWEQKYKALEEKYQALELTQTMRYGVKKINVCGVDCHQGDTKCNGYCIGKVSQAGPYINVV